MTGKATGAGNTGPERRRILYGRRRGRPLRPGRRALLDTLLPKLAITLPARGPLDPATLFDPRPRACWLEVGFGAGEHLVAQARARPDVGLIGCEPFINGVARLLSEIADDPPANLRLLADDARPLIDVLAEGSIDRLFVLFPDPWPKTRHHGRRFIGPTTLDPIARVLADEGELRLATDHAEYARWMLDHLGRHPAFEWTARSPRDWRERPADWPGTRYEAKARARGLRPVFLRYRRRPRDAKIP